MAEHAFSAAGIPAGRARAGDRAPGAVAALAVAGACFAALVLVWALVNHVTAVQWKDAVALHDFTQLSRPGIDGVASFLLHLLDPTQFVLWGVALVAVAFARERPRVAVAVIVVMALAPFTSETLKPLLAHPHIEIGQDHIGPASWPSGHSTAVLALVLSAVLVAPARLRRIVAAVGAAFALAVGCSLLILAWHMPSDVIGGYLVASCWAALAVAGLRLA